MKSVAIVTMFLLGLCAACKMHTSRGSRTLDDNRARPDAGTNDSPSFMRGSKKYQTEARQALEGLKAEDRETIQRATTKMLVELRDSFVKDQDAFLRELIDMSQKIFYSDKWNEHVRNIKAADPQRAGHKIAAYLTRYAIMREIIQDNPGHVQYVYNRAFSRANGGAPLPPEQFFMPSVEPVPVTVAVFFSLAFASALLSPEKQEALSNAALPVGAMCGIAGFLYLFVEFEIDQIKSGRGAWPRMHAHL